MKNKIIALITAFFALSSTAFAATDASITLNGAQLICDPTAMVEGEQVMVPLRAIFEELGASLIWDGEKRSIVVAKDATIVLLQIGNTDMFVNGDKIELDVAPVIVKDRTLVSLNAVNKALGIDIKYVPETNEVNINY